MKRVGTLSGSVAEGHISRRCLIGGSVAIGSMFIIGCSPSNKPQADSKEATHNQATSSSQRTAMVVYRDPSCGCCKSWANIAREAGYEVSLIDIADMAALKRELGVPEELDSCHTATVQNLVFEGHVPIQDISRLLADPGNSRGLAVPGMPVGSPGMEMPDGTKQAFEVLAFDAGGKATVYSAY